jgi:hypothetical protein
LKICLKLLLVNLNLVGTEVFGIPGRLSVNSAVAKSPNHPLELVDERGRHQSFDLVPASARV